MLAGAPWGPRRRSPLISLCSLYFCRWTWGGGRGKLGLKEGGEYPQLGWAGQSPLLLSSTVDSPQMGWHSLILP